MFSKDKSLIIFHYRQPAVVVILQKTLKLYLDKECKQTFNAKAFLRFWMSELCGSVYRLLVVLTYNVVFNGSLINTKVGQHI